MSSKVAIIGVGLVGSAWAIVFSRAGYAVSLYDDTADQCEDALSRIRTNLAALQEYRLIDDAAEISARITTASSLSEALDDATYAQESVFEDAEIKRKVYQEMDKFAGPNTVIGSSSSGIPSSVFTKDLDIGARCLIAHPINPPYLIPLVEVVPAPWSADTTVKLCCTLMKKAGMEPVQLNREVDGFIANRLQAVLLWEAFRLLEGGYASAGDIDNVISAGLGRRWCFMGPFETIDLNAPMGLSDFIERLGDDFYEFVRQGEPSQPLSSDVVSTAHAERRSLLPMTQHGDRQAWRDRRLMDLAAHFSVAGTNWLATDER